jgi:glycerol uptake facilitator-like aquaporin
LDSLAAVVLQNRRDLDLITEEKGGISVFLGEECCFYANQSGIVRENARQLLERIKAKERNKEMFWNTGWKSWAPWVAPIAGPLTCSLCYYS